VSGALSDHGKVVEHVSWRVDQVALSNRGDKIGLPVAMLTLGFVEGGRCDQTTMQIGVDKLRELGEMCDRLLRKPW
jgi:hypothetical protein